MRVGQVPLRGGITFGENQMSHHAESRSPPCGHEQVHLVSAIETDGEATVLDWLKIHRHLIRFPENSPGWERPALAFFKERGTVRVLPISPSSSSWQTARA